MRTKSENTVMSKQAKVGGKLAESWSYSYVGSSLQKIESRVNWQGAVMIIHVLSGWLATPYPIRRAFLQHIRWRISVEYVINKRKSLCHFAWSRRNGSIAVWMFVPPTNTAVILDLKGFLINHKLFLSTSEYHHYYQRRKWKMPDYWNLHDNSLVKGYRFICSCRLFFYYWSCLSRLAALVCFLAVVPFVTLVPHFAPTASRKKQAANKILFAMRNTEGWLKIHT